MGVNADNTGTQNDYSSGRFAGVRVVRSNDDQQPRAFVDEVQLVGDTVHFRHSQHPDHEFLKVKADGGPWIDLIPFLRQVAARLKISVQP